MRGTSPLSGHQPQVGRERARVRGTCLVPRLLACATAGSSSSARDNLPSTGFAKTCRLAITLLTLWTLLAASASAVERFPPPDFSDHKLPVTTTPPPEFAANPYVDVALLALALALASYLAIGRRSRRGLFVLTIASLAWFGFVRNGCICPIGSIQNVTLAIFHPSYAVPWAVAAFFVLPILFTLFFGRTFCASVCPLGAVQELAALRPVNVPAWVDHSLGLLSYVYLGLGVLLAATGTTFLICRYDPFVSFFRLSGSVNMLIFGACFLVVGVFIGRPYCRYLCPYGAILRLVSRFSKWHVTIPPDECIRCRLCEDVCPYGAIREPTVAQAAPQRRRGRRRLVLLIALAPLWIALGFWLGTRLEVPLAEMHPTVRLADRIRQEQTGRVEGTIDASDAFRNTGRAPADLYREALALSATFRTAGGWFGAWIGLVIAVKLIHLSLRRQRTDYQPDRAACVSCGRCFWYCPVEQAKQGWIQEITPAPQRP
jgi:NosR/NirI family transcriptional regulator, nitrous oxide reductase regulator